jgi:hypothetical protein
LIKAPEAGDYTIRVQAAYLFSAARPQKYALVVLGGFEGTLDSPFNPAISPGTGDATTPPASTAATVTGGGGVTK